MSLFQKSDDAVSFVFEPACPLLIALLLVRLAVLRTIHFNDEPRCHAGKIGNEGTNRYLTSEMRALCLQLS